MNVDNTMKGPMKVNMIHVQQVQVSGKEMTVFVCTMEKNMMHESTMIDIFEYL